MLKHVNNCQEALSKIKETNKLGVAPEMVKIAKTSRFICESKKNGELILV
jgi:hypothetical protein